MGATDRASTAVTHLPSFVHRRGVTLLAYEFVRSYADYSIFTYSKGNKFMALLICVDDLVGNEDNLCAELKVYLHQCFCIKDISSLKYFLGIEVACN